MKTVIMVLLTYFPLVATAQVKYTEWNNWKIERKNLIWQLVVDDSTVTLKDAENHLRSYAWCKDIYSAESVGGKADNYVIDYRRHKNHSSLPLIYKIGKWDFTVRYEMKPGKYRITVESVSFEAGSVSGGFYDIPVNGPYDDVVLKKERDIFKSSQLNYLSTLSEELKRILVVTRKSATTDW
jgi:hypothetical protein